MNDQEKISKTAEILTLGKALAPDRFPKPSREAGAAWAKSLDRLFDQMPEEIWEEAVHVWAMELVGNHMITPKELKAAVYVVRDRWESDPTKREILNTQRERNRELRDRQLDDGSFSELRGYNPPPKKPLPNPDRDVAGLLKKIGKKAQ